MADSVKHLISLRDQLKKELASTSPNLQNCNQLLVQSKIAFTQLGAFTPVPGQTQSDVMLAARDILETGAYYSVRIKDIDSFERYIAQLHTYYHDLVTALPPSSQMYPLLGLNLLRLLSQNRLSDFHTALEAIEPDQLQNNPYIKQAVDLEQFLMEGSYNKVWNTRKSVHGEEFLFFYDVLMNTIREEIANCSEKAYDSLPLQDASTLLFLKNTQELMTFAEQRGWKVSPGEQMIHFGSDDKDTVEIPQEQIITQTLLYAKELERISVMFSDLECDYINPIDLCSKLNKFIMPEMVGHAFLFCLFLVNGNWLSMLINLPLVAYNAMQVRQSKHQLDPTEIFRTLSVHKKEAFVKIGFYCTCFFYYLYCMIVALIALD
ncbi:cornichon protein-domain-containing protein [Syncephalastrum racemosum]|uniref:Cornichon protein-domain-containing protein n=1 Tax=Syncephalastrum racemosum TaxID=13706 RepID=A0A1X2H7Q5_SYNRA|nr:cornichon protein-domain-containing protein [Syncephalastrum racemosum]